MGCHRVPNSAANSVGKCSPAIECVLCHPVCLDPREQTYRPFFLACARPFYDMILQNLASRRLQSNIIYWHKSLIFPFVADNLGPQVVYCPPDQNITATKMRTVVTWNTPRFKDNSNSPLVMTCSHQSGTEFYWGTWNVHCTAYDNNPNNKPAVCQFRLTVKRK